MKQQDISTAIIAAYGDLFKALAINKETGILGTISNKRYSNRLGKIRFSGYPFIGSNYSEASPKILVVGLDIGQDEKYQEYGIVIYLLKDYYGWSDVWNRYFEVLGDLPSSWRNGANKPTYVDKLSLINW